jgi:hypothetical protein
MSNTAGMLRALRPAVGAALALSTSAAHADLIFAGPRDQMGTGFGNVLNVLSLQSRPSESGSVLRQGGVDVLTGDATNQSATRSVAELLAAGVDASNLGVVFNINEPGSSPQVTLQQFQLVFTDNTGNTLFTQNWTGPLTLEPANQGTGGAGYVFDINLTPAQAQQLFSDPTNRIGLAVTTPILGSMGGPENFYLVPGPAGAAVGFIALAGAARRRRRTT